MIVFIITGTLRSSYADLSLSFVDIFSFLNFMLVFSCSN